MSIEIECPICLEIVDDDINILQCKHIYHKTCFEKYINTCEGVVLCPICRYEVMTIINPPQINEINNENNNILDIESQQQQSSNDPPNTSSYSVSECCFNTRLVATNIILPLVAIILLLKFVFFPY